MFISLEGVDGSGKTTIAQGFMQQLQALGYEVIYTREPGGNNIAEAIRTIILNPHHTNMDAKTEALLYAAARRQHLVDVISPALALQKIVLCDRFIDSSVAYQGYARKIGAQQIKELNDFATSGIIPELTLLIDVKPEIGLKRIKQDQTREINRLDLENLEFHQAVYQGYQKLAKQAPNRIKVINGQRATSEIIAELYEIIKTRLENERLN